MLSTSLLSYMKHLSEYLTIKDLVCYTWDMIEYLCVEFAETRYVEASWKQVCFLPLILCNKMMTLSVVQLYNTTM